VKILIEAEKLKAYYNIDLNRFVRAVDDVSLSIKEEEIVGIAGESGCGKSTLLKVLIASVNPPLTMLEGKVLYNIDGEKIDILSLDKNRLRDLRWKVFSFIPQNAMNSLNPVSKIRKIFLETISAHQKIEDREQAEKLIEDIFEKTGLSKKFLGFYPVQLSGGMKQRVVVALATILKPKMIFCDEPTSGLDLISQKNILQLLQELQKELKNMLVLVSHDMGILAQATDRIIIMYAGKIVESAPTKKIFEEPYHPYTNALINLLPVIGDKSRKIVFHGTPPSLINPPKGCRFSRRCPFSKSACEKEGIPLVKVEPDRYVACLRFGV